MIKVANVKHQQQNLNSVYIGRRYGRCSASPLANPFKIGRDGDREQVIIKYQLWLDKEIEKKEAVWEELLHLSEKYRLWGDLTLLCWCSPLPCHGDIIKQRILEIQKFE